MHSFTNILQLQCYVIRCDHSLCDWCLRLLSLICDNVLSYYRLAAPVPQ